MKKTAASAPEKDANTLVPVEGEQPMPDAADTQHWYDVNPGETVSICAGNRVLFMGTGVTGIMVHQAK